jgi:hypothetical protein
MEISLFGWLDFASLIKKNGTQKKGAQSSGPCVGSQARKTTRRYPQKVWITLWVEPFSGAKTASIYANPLSWSNNDHCIKRLKIN